MGSENKMNAVLLYASLNSADIKNFLAVDVKKFKENGELNTLYGRMSIENIILRLMDNRDFQVQSDEVKSEMIYSDYYPEEARLSNDIFLDNRWNMCQELHNKLCAQLRVPATKLRFVDFEKEKMDNGCFSHYNPFDGILYMNSNIMYHECDKTELVERVLQGTFEHSIYMNLRSHFYRITELEEVDRYIFLSSFNKLLAFSTLTDEGLQSIRSDMEYSDGHSASSLYSVFMAYQYLNKMFEDYDLYDKIDLKDFKEAKDCFFASLADDAVYEVQTGEDVSELDGYDELDDEEREFLNPDVEQGLLYDTKNYDLDILHIINTSVLNEQIGGGMFNTILKEMDKCSKQFYGFFGSKMDLSLIKEYKQYKSEVDAEESEAMEE